MNRAEIVARFWSLVGLGLEPGSVVTVGQETADTGRLLDRKGQIPPVWARTPVVGPGLFFFVDLEPGAVFPHRCIYVVVTPRHTSLARHMEPPASYLRMEPCAPAAAPGAPPEAT